ncbi:MAG: hypothetical protein ACRDEA_10410, partial [Microcystaceae cyanobacterium]
VEHDPQKHSVTYIQTKDFGQVTLDADFIIDATGLDAKAQANPLLEDLVKHYNLPLNYLGRLFVANNFELLEMRHAKSQMYVAGAITLDDLHAAVDSFLGLQYAALCAVDGLVATRAPGIHRLNAFSSFGQCLKWVFNQSP